MPTGSEKTLAALLPAPLEQKAAVMATASDLFAVQERSGQASRGHVSAAHRLLEVADGSVPPPRSSTSSPLLPPSSPSPSGSPTAATGAAASAAQMSQAAALLPPTIIVVMSTRAITGNGLEAARRLDVTAAYWSPDTAAGVTLVVVYVGVLVRRGAAFRLCTSARDAHGRLARLVIAEAHQSPLWSVSRRDNAGLAERLAAFPTPIILLSGTISRALHVRV